MSSGFVRGGNGVVQLMDVLSPQLRTASRRVQQEAAADAYEAAHPGAVVERPWETPQQLAERIAGRKITEHVKPTSGMDPDRAAAELGRLRAQIEGLTPEHPEYDKLFRNLVREIHVCEREVGISPLTNFVKGEKVEKAKDAVSPEAQAKLDKYAQLAAKNKAASIGATKDVAYLKLIRDTELDPALQQATVERLMTLGAL